MAEICSYKFEKIAIDIMPAEDSSIGISNKWYKPGFKYLQQIQKKMYSSKGRTEDYWLHRKVWKKALNQD